jgi:hypothetical protein
VPARFSFAEGWPFLASLAASWVPLAEPPWDTADHTSGIGHTLNPPTFISAVDHIAAYRGILARAGVQS